MHHSFVDGDAARIEELDRHAHLALGRSKVVPVIFDDRGAAMEIGALHTFRRAQERVNRARRSVPIVRIHGRLQALG